MEPKCNKRLKQAMKRGLFSPCQAAFALLGTHFLHWKGKEEAAASSVDVDMTAVETGKNRRGKRKDEDNGSDGKFPLPLKSCLCQQCGAQI